MTDNEKIYRFVYCGRIKRDAEKERVKKKISDKYKVDNTRLDELFSGKRIIVKSNLTRMKAESLQVQFKACGAIGDVEEVLGEEHGDYTSNKRKQEKKKEQKFVGILWFIFGLLFFVGLVRAGYQLILEADKKGKFDEDFVGVYGLLADIERFVVANKEYPHRLEPLLEKHDIPNRMNIVIDEYGVVNVSSRSSSNNMELGYSGSFSYTPKFLLGKLDWECFSAMDGEREPPIECQSNDQWKKNGILVESNDKNLSIVIPEWWRKIDERNDVNLSYVDFDERVKMLLVSEPKTDFDSYSYGNYAKVTLDMLLDNMVQKYQINVPRNRTINGLRGIEYVYEHVAGQNAKTYMILVVDGVDYYHRFVFEIPKNRSHYLLPKLRVITGSIIERYAPNTDPLKARIVYSHGIYEGQVVAGEPKGEGRFLWHNGDEMLGIYNGEAINGGLNYRWNSNDSDKAEFEGELDSNVFNGRGVYRWSDGVYKGQIGHGRAEGEGVLVWSDRTQYKGHFNSGYFHGAGRYTWPDGDYYEGSFKDGRFDGKGVCHYGGQAVQCFYREGKRMRLEN